MTQLSWRVSGAGSFLAFCKGVIENGPRWYEWGGERYIKSSWNVQSTYILASASLNVPNALNHQFLTYRPTSRNHGQLGGNRRVVNDIRGSCHISPEELFVGYTWFYSLSNWLKTLHPSWNIPLSTIVTAAVTAQIISRKTVSASWYKTIINTMFSAFSSSPATTISLLLIF